MALNTQPYKGTRDFYPEDKRLQKYIFNTLRSVAERFGYEEYDAPILEPLELFLAKTGEEIIKEQTYTFEDRGGRAVAIRPEMTPSVSRMVAAKRQELVYPLRWYSIPNLWRYERPQRGRLREHWQLNVDLFGIEDIKAELEMLLIIDSIMKAFGAGSNTYTIKLNSRRLMDKIFSEYLGLTVEQSYGIGKLVDRRSKMNDTAFLSEVKEVLGATEGAGKVIERLTNFLQVSDINQLPAELSDDPSVGSLKTLTRLLESAGVKNFEFDPNLMRGFDYYTDIVFEVFDTDPENNRSMFGGGRYDGLVGLFGVEPIATIGFGMGDVTLANFLESRGLLPDIKPETKVYVALVGDVYEKAASLIDSLRKNGINVAVDYSGRKLGVQIATAQKKKINQVLITGDQEISAGLFTLRNIYTSDEIKLDLPSLIAKLKEQ